jgi:hypothetical protein
MPIQLYLPFLASLIQHPQKPPHYKSIQIDGTATHRTMYPRRTQRSARRVRQVQPCDVHNRLPDYE